jgi:3-methyladenine DNA glycosylase/8-oxoguanine DNA glycosylase
MTIRLDCRAPFDWQHMLEFLSGRATPGVECVVDGTYHRTLAVPGGHALVRVSPDASGNQLLLQVDGIDARQHADVAALAASVFDVDAPVDEVAAVLSRDEFLRNQLGHFPGIRVPGAWDGFELTVRAILGQQISVKAATTLAGRIASRYGRKLAVVDAPGPLDRLFPTPERLSTASFDDIGLVRSRARTIRDVASAVVKGDIKFDKNQAPAEFRRTLTSIRGIGEWTAQYVSMRALRDPDAFPDSDLGLIKAVARPERIAPKELRKRAEAWRPYRAYAAMLLWSSLPGSGG